MATTTLTSNLKLRVSSDLTNDSKYNLRRIDTLASLYQVDTTDVAKLRSITDIVIQPQDPDIGGLGTGGTISFGTDDQPAGTIKFRATTLDLTSVIDSDSDICTTSNFCLKSGDYQVSLASPSLSSSYTLTLPLTAGTPNQVLTTDGSGNLSWQTVAGAGSSGQELAVDWMAADGMIKTITHGFGSQSVMAQILDVQDNYKTIDIDVIYRPDANTIVLEASIMPVHWQVLLKEI